MRKNLVMWAGAEGPYLSNSVSGSGSRKIHVFDSNIKRYIDEIIDYFWAYEKVPRPDYKGQKVEVKWIKH